MTFVKICGLSQKKHVLAAVEAGATMIGFVFAPSKRQVTTEQATELAQYIPKGIKNVGVFVNSDKETIIRIFNDVPLDYVQYHGDETNEFIQQIGLPSIKAFPIHTEEDVLRASQYDVDYYLFDTPSTTYRGGSGETFDWSLIKNSPIPTEKIIIAGGLNSENVLQAITLISPAGVDVSSGVERDGQKDSALITQFLATVKGVIV